MTSLLRLVTSAPILLRAHAELTPVRAGDSLVTATIGPYGEAIALWSSTSAASGSSDSSSSSSSSSRSARRSRRARIATASTAHPLWASMPAAARRDPVAARVTVYWPDPTAIVNIAELDLRQPLLQPLPAGRTLIVSARCAWHAAGPDHNARVFDADGVPVATTTLGDGISHLLSTPAGDVWVGYTEEGVFGGYGWGGAAAEPIGGSGLVRFDGALRPAWRFPPAAGQAPPFGECRALNVTGQSAWVSSFPEFPLAQVTDESVRGWRNSVGGVRAIMVDGSRCALFGGYGTDSDRVVMGALWDEFVPQRESVLLLPDCRPLPPDARLVARGHVLNVFAGTRWFKVDTELLPP